MKFQIFVLLVTLISSASCCPISDAIGVQMARATDMMNTVFYRMGIPMLENTKKAIFMIGNWMEEDAATMNSRLEQMNLSDSSKKQAENLKSGLSKLSYTLKSINDGVLNNDVNMAGQVLTLLTDSVTEIITSAFSLIFRGVGIGKLLPRMFEALMAIQNGLMKDIQAFFYALLSNLSSLLHYLPGLSSLQRLSGPSFQNASPNFSGFSGYIG